MADLAPKPGSVPASGLYTQGTGSPVQSPDAKMGLGSFVENSAV